VGRAQARRVFSKWNGGQQARWPSKARQKGNDIVKPKLNFATALALGTGAGAALGVALHNLAVGVALGTAIGMAFALALGSRRKKSGASQ
jgi:hypothetical protein